jgi:hypothetical protein
MDDGLFDWMVKDEDVTVGGGELKRQKGKRAMGHG